MKHFLFLAFACLLMLGACKEIGPAIDFGPRAADTSFMALPETAQPRIVVIEEFTGVTCPNCPRGHTTVKAIEDANPNRIAALGIQIFGFNQCNPVNRPEAVTRHDNRTQAGTAIANDIYGSVSTMPIGGIDRVESGGSMQLYTGSWAATVTDRLATPPAANIKITTTYNTGTRQAYVTVHVAYTASIAKPQKLTLALVEDNIVDAQEGVGTTGAEQEYIHQHVLRDVLTAAGGDAILSDKATKQPGQVYERTFIYNVDSGWNADNCRLIAYVSNNDGADKEVVQGAELHLK